MGEKWDLRFLDMAKLVSTWSKDPSTKCGAVIVAPDKSVVGIGYNGFPRLMSDADEIYADREAKYSRVIHCEMNAVFNSNRSVHGCTLYTYPYGCCDRCAAHMIQAGIVRWVFPYLPEDKKERWEKSINLGVSYIEEAGLDYTVYDYHPNNRLDKIAPICYTPVQID